MLKMYFLIDIRLQVVAVKKDRITQTDLKTF